MQNQSNLEITFGTQLKTALINIKLLKYKIDPVTKSNNNQVFTLQSSLKNSFGLLDPKTTLQIIKFQCISCVFFAY